jgi:hypothetical protein
LEECGSVVTGLNMTKRRLARCYILSPILSEEYSNCIIFCSCHSIHSHHFPFFCVGGKKNWWMTKLLLELRCEHLIFCSLFSSTSLLPSSCLLLWLDVVAEFFTFFFRSPYRWRLLANRRLLLFLCWIRILLCCW